MKLLTSDAQIATLIAIKKRIYGTNNPKRVNKLAHTEINYRLVDDDGNHYHLYVRQSNKQPQDFSAGLSIIDDKGVHHTIKRYNGPSHSHPNHIEGTETGYECHIHIASERYIKAKRSPEGYAEATDRYHSLNGALHCLVLDCNITGIRTIPDQPLLFRTP